MFTEDIDKINRLCDEFNIPEAPPFKPKIKKPRKLKNPYKGKKHIVYKDHIGNTYAKLEDMCQFWHISLETYHSRKKRKWDIEKILTSKDVYWNCKPTAKPIDHLGNEFTSWAKMCRHYNTTYDRVRRKLEKGWSLEEALTQHTHAPIIDPFGNHYTTIGLMCSRYQIPVYKFLEEYHNGIPIRKFLMRKPNTELRFEYRTVMDIDGSIYSSLTELCNKYHIPPYIYEIRQMAGWSLKDTLLTPFDNNNIWKNDIVQIKNTNITAKVTSEPYCLNNMICVNLEDLGVYQTNELIKLNKGDDTL